MTRPTGRTALHQQGLMEGRRPDGTARHVQPPNPPPAAQVLKGLPADIYYRLEVPDCSNDGISRRANEVTIVAPRQITERIGGVREPSEDAPAVQIVARRIGPRIVVHAEPIDRPPGMLGPMMGGTYIATSDSRLNTLIAAAVSEQLGVTGYSFYGALALHDRYETQAQYDALSI